MEERPSDAELRVMELLWKEGPMPAGQIARALQAQVGWNRNTSYTLIKRCIDKGMIHRSDPGFVCTPAVDRADVQRREARALVDRMFEGSQSLLFAAMLDGNRISEAEAAQLYDMIDKASKGGEEA